MFKYCFNVRYLINFSSRAGSIQEKGKENTQVEGEEYFILVFLLYDSLELSTIIFYGKNSEETSRILIHTHTHTHTVDTVDRCKSAGVAIAEKKVAINERKCDLQT